MKLGLVTYNIAKDWALPELIERCEAAGFEGVELRTGHAHGVEAGLSATERETVRERFEKSRVKLAGLGTAFEFHSTDPGEVRRNIEGTKEYAQLAADLGCPGVKVRPNGVQTDRGVPIEQTLRQIGEALRECANYAAGHNVEIRLEVHGKVTCEVPNIRKILDYADHENVFVCWNSNPSDVIKGSVRKNFALLADRIRLVHMRDLFTEDYPWIELFWLLQKQGYDGFCLAEIPASSDPARVLSYYRALWRAYLKLTAARR